MGKLNKAVLGLPPGNVGQVLFREIDGKVYIGTRPKSFMPGTDVPAVNRRKRFGLTGKFAKAINSIDKVKIVWDAVTPNNISPYNGIFKANYPNVTPDTVSDTALLSPGIGFNSAIDTAVIDNTGIQVTLEALGVDSGIDPLIETHIVMAAVISCNVTSDVNLKPNYFLAFKSAPVATNLVNPLSFSVAFKEQEATYYDKYTNHKTFLAFVTLNAEGKPVQYSSTSVQ